MEAKSTRRVKAAGGGRRTKRGAKRKTTAPRKRHTRTTKRSGGRKTVRTKRATRTGRATTRRTRTRKKEGGRLATAAVALGAIAGRVAKVVSEPLARAKKAKKSAGTDATKLLKSDHVKVKTLFRAFQATPNRATKMREKLYEQIDKALEVHTRIEEEIFYPAVRQLRGVANERITEAFHEHAIVKQLLAEIREEIPGSNEFNAKMKMVIDNVLHHARGEESEIFPLAKRGLGDDRLKMLGRQLEARKEALASAHPRKRAV
jgi:hemerythrin superfamily protein